MRKLLVLLLTFVLALSLVACGGADTPVEADETEDEHLYDGEETGEQYFSAGGMVLSNPTGDTWTVMVYLCGTDLETGGGFASVNLEEMAISDMSEQVNVLVQTGGTEQWQTDGIDPDQIERWHITHDGIMLEDCQPPNNMGAAETLGSFLRWGIENYPADKYMTVLWDHGGGSVAGIAVDELFDGDTLDLKELSEGLSMAGVQFELVGFDACLMSTMEVAAAMTPYARYMVASQELEPGTGWDYTDFLSFMAQEPTADGLDVGTRICDGFYEKCALENAESMATLAVTDLEKMPALLDAFDDMAAEMKGFTANTNALRPLTQAITRAENYGGNNDAEGYTNMVDLGDLTLNAEGILSDTGMAVIDCLISAVPYQVAGEARQRGNGLSLYVPLAVSEDDLDSYATLAATSGEYLRFIEGLYDWTAPSDIMLTQPVYPTAESSIESEMLSLDDVPLADALDPDAYALNFSTDITDDGSILLTMNSGADIVSTVAFNLYYLDEESDSLWYLGTDFDLNSDETGTQFWDNYRHTWTIINDNLCMMVALGFTDEYILYTVPVLVNGEETNLRMLYRMESGAYEVLGTWDGIDGDSGMASREITQLVDGDVVEFVFDAANMTTGEDASFVGGGFTVNGAVVAEEAELFDGTYYYEYEITDVFGRVYTSDLTTMECSDGEITVSM